MLAVGPSQQQQKPVGLAWLLPALGSAATASCQFVCPQWTSVLASQVQSVAVGACRQPERASLTGPAAAYPSQLLRSSGCLAGLPPLFAPPALGVESVATSDRIYKHPSSGNHLEEARPDRIQLGQQQHLVRNAPTSLRQVAHCTDDASSLQSCDSLSEQSRTLGDDQSDSYLSSQGSQQTSSSALEALLAVADTCSHTGCLNSKEALEAARQRYELAHCRAHGQAARYASQSASLRGSTDGSAGAPRAHSRRPGACAGVSKLTAQQRRARHRCNNPWSISETQALLEGIERCGVGKWADIQRLRLPAIIKRSPVDLKDKWRNLSRLAQDPNTGRVSNTVPCHLLTQVRQILGM